MTVEDVGGGGEPLLVCNSFVGNWANTHMHYTELAVRKNDR